jgi:hypothetical protein
MPVHDEGVIADRKPEPLGDRILALFNTRIDELFNTAAV